MRLRLLQSSHGPLRFSLVRISSCSNHNIHRLILPITVFTVIFVSILPLDSLEFYTKLTRLVASFFLRIILGMDAREWSGVSQNVSLVKIFSLTSRCLL